MRPGPARPPPSHSNTYEAHGGKQLEDPGPSFFNILSLHSQRLLPLRRFRLRHGGPYSLQLRLPQVTNIAFLPLHAAEVHDGRQEAKTQDTKIHEREDGLAARRIQMTGDTQQTVVLGILQRGAEKEKTLRHPVGHPSPENSKYARGSSKVIEECEGRGLSVRDNYL
jgi:hypothetical protein